MGDPQSSIKVKEFNCVPAGVDIALDQGYIEKLQFDELYQDADKIQRQLSNFIKYLESTLKRTY